MIVRGGERLDPLQEVCREEHIGVSEELEAEDHVVRRDGNTIVPPDVVSQIERPGAVVG